MGLKARNTQIRDAHFLIRNPEDNVRAFFFSQYCFTHFREKTASEETCIKLFFKMKTTFTQKLTFKPCSLTIWGRPR